MYAYVGNGWPRSQSVIVGAWRLLQAALLAPSATTHIPAAQVLGCGPQ